MVKTLKKDLGEINSRLVSAAGGVAPFVGQIKIEDLTLSGECMDHLGRRITFSLM